MTTLIPSYMLASPGRKNTIINGNFQSWQEGVTFTSIASSTYVADLFKWAQSGTGVVDVSKSTVIPDGTARASLKIGVTTAISATPPASDIYRMTYTIEGANILKYAFGTAAAKQLTLSFWVRSPKLGIHCVAFRGGGTSVAYISEYTINVVNTWEKKSITITADTANTWLQDNGAGLEISFALAVGATYQTPAGAWTLGTYFASSNQVNVMDNTANNFHVSQIQMELGEGASPFEHLSIRETLSNIYRYFRQIADAGLTNEVVCPVVITSSIGARGILNFPVEMRATPSIITNGFGNFEVAHRNTATILTALSIAEADSSSGTLALSVASGFTAGDAGWLRSDGTGLLYLNARL